MQKSDVSFDDLVATLTCKGYQFGLWMDWDGYISLYTEQEVPEVLFEELCNDLRAHFLSAI